MHRPSMHGSENDYLEALRQQWCSFGATERPQSLWIACSDSIMNRPLEQIGYRSSILLLRRPGNTISSDVIQPAKGISAVDYAVGCLGVRKLVICGHSMCSASESGNFAGVNENRKAGYEGLLQRTRQREEKNELAREHLVRQLAALAAHPCVAHAVQLGNLTLHGLFYLAESGLFLSYDAVACRFLIIDKPWQPA